MEVHGGVSGVIGGPGGVPFAVKLLKLAHASMRVPSTVVLGGQQVLRLRLGQHPLEEGPGDVALEQRSRFLVNTVGPQTGSSMLRPTNQRKRRL
jgi:hypothetical protein